jgi:hypothetical protein
MKNVPWEFLIFSLSMGALGLYGTHIWWSMVDEVNRKLPKEQQLEHLDWGPTKRVRLIREYKRLYPNGPLNRTRVIIQSLMFVVLILAAARLNRFL